MPKSVVLLIAHEKLSLDSGYLLVNHMKFDEK